MVILVKPKLDHLTNSVAQNPLMASHCTQKPKISQRPVSPTSQHVHTPSSPLPSLLLPPSLFVCVLHPFSLSSMPSLHACSIHWGDNVPLCSTKTSLTLLPGGFCPGCSLCWHPLPWLHGLLPQDLCTAPQSLSPFAYSLPWQFPPPTVYLLACPSSHTRM